MRAVGIKVLKNKLSEYVRLAAGGEVILVTDRDRVVAELTPPREGRSTSVNDAVLADLVRMGVMRPPLVRLHGPPPNTPRAPLEELLTQLDDDREER